MEELILIIAIGLGILAMFSREASQPEVQQIIVYVPVQPTRSGYGIWGIVIVVIIVALLFTSL